MQPGMSRATNLLSLPLMKTSFASASFCLFLCLHIGFGKEKADSSGKASIERNTQLQILLDQANFGPGKIDGKSGEFTQKALQRYKKSLGIGSGSASDYAPPSGANAVDASKIDPVFIDYVVTKEDVEAVVEIPEDRAAQARLKTLGYRSVLEGVGERFHCDIDFLKELNPKIASPKEGDVLKVPNVQPFELASVKGIKAGSGIAELKKAGIAVPEAGQRGTREGRSKEQEDDPVSVYVSTKDSVLEVKCGDRVCAMFPVTSGSEATPAPPGEWKVKAVATMPDFRYDKKLLDEGERGDDFVILPPGPNNPVGAVWIALNKDGIGIHGTDQPDTIGRSASHGCIRLANWDVVKLASLVKAGVPVTIE